MVGVSAALGSTSVLLINVDQTLECCVYEPSRRHHAQPTTGGPLKNYTLGFSNL
jgi:hypothetical protein